MFSCAKTLTVLTIIMLNVPPHHIVCSNTKATKNSPAPINQSYSYNTNNNYPTQLVQMSLGFLLSRALYVCAELNIADHLAAAPQKVDAHFAEKLHVNPAMLYRLLRMLASHDIVTEDQHGFFSLTPCGLCLCSGHPSGISKLLKMEDTTRWNAYGNLLETVQTGVPAFNSLFNTTYFEFIKNNPKLQHRFNEGMKSISLQEDALIPPLLSIDNNKSVVDIGGGTGNLLMSLKNAYPTTKDLIIFDYTPLTPEQMLSLQTRAIQFHQGSFLDNNTLPAKKDIYILKRILHDWDKEHCIRILKNCAHAMTTNSTLFIIDAAIATGNGYHISKDIDLIMMTLFGGQERTLTEFEEIISLAGLHITAIKPIESSMLSILEVKL